MLPASRLHLLKAGRVHGLNQGSPMLLLQVQLHFDADDTDDTDTNDAPSSAAGAAMRKPAVQSARQFRGRPTADSRHCKYNTAKYGPCASLRHTQILLGFDLSSFFLPPLIVSCRAATVRHK